MDPRIIGGVEKMIASGNIPAAIILFGLGTVMYVLNREKDLEAKNV